MDREQQLRLLLKTVSERNYLIMGVDPRLWVRQIEEICRQADFPSDVIRATE